jgi:hypothetical protein
MVLWLATSSLTGTGDDDSDLGRRMSASLALHTDLIVPMTLHTSSLTNLHCCFSSAMGGLLAGPVRFFLACGFGCSPGFPSW